MNSPGSVIGCGGISTVEDVIEYLIAGASAVQVGTATFIHPTIMLSLIDGLEDFINLDLPFKQEQRLSAVNDLSVNVDSARFSAAEKFRQILEVCHLH